jgi:hypothetical protein
LNAALRQGANGSQVIQSTQQSRGINMHMDSAGNGNGARKCKIQPGCVIVHPPDYSDSSGETLP